MSNIADDHRGWRWDQDEIRRSAQRGTVGFRPALYGSGESEKVAVEIVRYVLVLQLRIEVEVEVTFALSLLLEKNQSSVSVKPSSSKSFERRKSNEEIKPKKTE